MAPLDVWALGSQVGAAGLRAWGRGLRGKHLHPQSLRQRHRSGLATSRRKASKGIDLPKDLTTPERNAETFLSNLPERHQFTSGEDNTISALEATVCKKELHLGRLQQENVSCQDKERLKLISCKHISLRLFLPQ